MKSLEKQFYQQFIFLLISSSITMLIIVVLYVVFLLNVNKYWFYIIIFSVLVVPMVPVLIKELYGFCKDYKLLKSNQIPKITGEFIGYKKVNIGGDPPEVERRIIISEQLTNKQIILKGEWENLQEGNIYTFYYLPYTKFSIVKNL